MVTTWDVTIPELTKDETRKAYLYLPESYAYDEAARYPVLYMFDGHNVFFDSHATYGKSWGMKEYMDQLEQKIREEFDRIAKEEENALQNSGGFIMPEGKKEELYTAIREKAGKSGNSSGETSGDVQSADVAEMPGEDRGELALADASVAGRGAGAGRRNLSPHSS